MIFSLISTLKNRANLLHFGLDGVLRQEGLSSFSVEVNIGDGGSTDSLDDVLKEISQVQQSDVVNKYVIDRGKSALRHVYNCPAEEYNILVRLSTNQVIVKIDPEFVLLTPTFLKRAYDIVQDRHAIVLPFPYHAHDFSFNSFDDIANNYSRHVYPTHITQSSYPNCNVYYGAVFKRSDYLKLGGIDERFVEGIGSEDDFFLDRWRTEYGADNVITLPDCIGVHLWHGDGGQSISQDLMPLVTVNAELRDYLNNIGSRCNQDSSWGKVYDFERVRYRRGVVL